MPETIQQLLTPPELAALLRIPLWTAWRLARERRIPGVIRVGKFVRFDRRSVTDWLAAGGSLNGTGHDSPPGAA